MVVRTEVEFSKIANFLLKISMIYIFRFIFFKYHIYIYMYMFMILSGSFNIIGMQDVSEINGQTLSTYSIFASICSSNVLTEHGY